MKLVCPECQAQVGAVKAVGHGRFRSIREARSFIGRFAAVTNPCQHVVIAIHQPGDRKSSYLKLEPA